MNSRPKLPEIGKMGHHRSPEMDTQFPEWGSQYPEGVLTQFPESGHPGVPGFLKGGQLFLSREIDFSGQDMFGAPEKTD